MKQLWEATEESVGCKGLDPGMLTALDNLEANIFAIAVKKRSI
jgi:hypothetical protein